MNTLLHDFVSDMEGRAEQQHQQQSTTSSASPGLDRKRKVDHETEEPAFLDEAAPAVPPSANGDDAEGKVNHLKKSPESDNDSDHRGRKAVKSGNDHAEQEDSSSSAQASPNDSGLDKPTEGEDQDGDDEVVAVAEDDEAADAPTARSREPTDARPPSPPPLPLHRHRPSAGARCTFDNLMADAADASPSSTHRSTVIAAVVVFDGEGRVLLVQEAKPKCRGLWYLPGTYVRTRVRWCVCGGACVVLTRVRTHVQRVGWRWASRRSRAPCARWRRSRGCSWSRRASSRSSTRSASAPARPGSDTASPAKSSAVPSRPPTGYLQPTTPHDTHRTPHTPHDIHRTRPDSGGVDRRTGRVSRRGGSRSRRSTSRWGCATTTCSSSSPSTGRTATDPSPCSAPTSREVHHHHHHHHHLHHQLGEPFCAHIVRPCKYISTTQHVEHDTTRACAVQISSEEAVDVVHEDEEVVGVAVGRHTVVLHLLQRPPHRPAFLR